MESWEIGSLPLSRDMTATHFTPSCTWCLCHSSASAGYPYRDDGCKLVSHGKPFISPHSFLFPPKWHETTTRDDWYCFLILSHNQSTHIDMSFWVVVMWWVFQHLFSFLSFSHFLINFVNKESERESIFLFPFSFIIAFFHSQPVMLHHQYFSTHSLKCIIRRDPLFVNLTVHVERFPPLEEEKDNRERKKERKVGRQE